MPSQPAKHSPSCPGLFLAAIIIYVIAWQVTGIKLNRLVERFNDARIVATNLLNPDVITISVKARIRSAPGNACTLISATSWRGGQQQGVIRLSENFLNIIGQDETFACSSVAGESGAGRSRQ